MTISKDCQVYIGFYKSVENPLIIELFKTII